VGIFVAVVVAAAVVTAVVVELADVAVMEVVLTKLGTGVSLISCFLIIRK